MASHTSAAPRDRRTPQRANDPFAAHRLTRGGPSDCAGWLVEALGGVIDRGVVSHARAADLATARARRMARNVMDEPVPIERVPRLIYKEDVRDLQNAPTSGPASGARHRRQDDGESWIAHVALTRHCEKHRAKYFYLRAYVKILRINTVVAL